MRPDTWYGQAMASFDKEKFQARLEKMSTDEIHEKMPNFRGKKKSAASDELVARVRAAIDESVARARDEKIKSRSRKETARRTVVLCAVVLAICAVITLVYLALL